MTSSYKNDVIKKSNMFVKSLLNTFAIFQNARARTIMVKAFQLRGKSK